MHGWILPPALILIWDMFVYSEFMVHPVVLLATSTKMREEVAMNIQQKYQEIKGILCCICCCSFSFSEVDESERNSSKRHSIHVIELNNQRDQTGGRNTTEVYRVDVGTMTNFLDVAQLPSPVVTETVA